MGIREYVLGLIDETGCDLTAYHGLNSDMALIDLKEWYSYHDKPIFSLEDMAKELIEISNENYIVPKTKKYTVVYNTNSFTGGFECDSIADAKGKAIEILIDWINDKKHSFSTSTNSCVDDKCYIDSWNDMIYNCYVGVVDFATNETVWEPSDYILKEIGWVEK